MALKLTGTAVIFTSGDDAAVKNVLIPALGTHPDLKIECLSDQELPADQGLYPTLKRILGADVVCVDAASVSGGYIAGLREGLSAFPTLIYASGKESADRLNPLSSKIIYLGEKTAAQEISQRLDSFAATGQGTAPLREDDVLNVQYRLSPKTAVPSRLIWTVGDRKSGSALQTKLAIRGGDLRAVKDVPLWINSENIFMEMAGVYDRTISGVIRFLGANWRNNHLESDDALRRELAERMGARRSVDIGDVLFTPVSKTTDLYKINGVELVAHVATVAPVQVGQAGGGYTATEGLRFCMQRALGEIDRWNSRRFRPGDPQRQVLIPLFGTGRGGADVSVASQILINAAHDYIQDTPDTSLDCLWFLARTPFDIAACERAMDSLPDAQREGDGA